MSRSVVSTFLRLAALGLAFPAAHLLLAAEPPRPWPPDPFAPVTLERIAALPAAEQSAWRAYWEASAAMARGLPQPKAPEFSPLVRIEGPPIGSRNSRGLRLQAPAPWFAGEEAQTIADRVVACQTRAGAWTKGNDYTREHPQAEEQGDLWARGTLDNDATVSELRFLARVATAAPGGAGAASWRDAFLRGLRYLFSAQYPNGGFPQIYPLAGGYHDAITFNDDAMIHALTLLQDVAAAKPEFRFVPADLRAEAERRVARGIGCIRATQLRSANGSRTVWCQQYDALTLRPCAARNFEPIAACAAESVGIVEFLMRQPQSPAEVRSAVDAAVTWFRKVALPDRTWTRNAAGQARLEAAPGAPAIWARFYEIGTDTPIFGDRDRTIHYAVDELSSERRDGYAWYGSWPARLLAAYPRWREGQPVKP